MNSKVIIALACLGTIAIASACSSSKPKKVENKKPVNECKLVGAWENDTTSDKRVVNMEFDVKNGQLAVGTFKSGDLNQTSTFAASGAVASTIESGKEQPITWKFNNNSEECKMTFINECAELKVTCNSGNPLVLMRSK